MPDALPSDLPSRDDVEQLVRRWVKRAADASPDPDAERLADLLRDPRGLDFALGIADRVIRPDDPAVAARDLERLSRKLPQALPRALRAAVVAGGGFGMLLPQPVVPTARAAFRRLVRHLVVETGAKSLDRRLGALRREGVAIDATLLGEPALGDRGADEHLAALLDLLDRPDVDGVTLTVPSIAGGLTRWGFDDDVARVAERLGALYARAARGRRTVVTLEVERFADLDLTIAVLARVLALPAFLGLEAGIALPATLPEALPAFDRLAAWARDRVAAGGAPLRVRIGPGGPIGEERVAAAVGGHPLATWDSHDDTRAHHVRLLARALRPENAGALAVVAAGCDPFPLAFARLLAERHGVPVHLEVTPGLAPALAEALDPVVLAVSAVDPAAFSGAVPLLVRRLQEAAALTPLDELADDAVFARESARFAADVERAADPVPTTRRTQDRSHPAVPRAPEPFANAEATDPLLPGNRAWARDVLHRAASSVLGLETVAAARTDAAGVRECVRAAVTAGAEWGRLPGSARAELLDRAGEVLAAFRGRLVEVAIAETAATLDDADAEAGEAVDLAHYVATRARELAGIRGAVFEPVPLTVVTTSAKAPLAAPAENVLAALAAGSAVLLVPHPAAARTAAVLVDALGEAGVPRDVLRLVLPADDEARAALLAAPEAGRVLVDGSLADAERVRDLRPDAPLLARTSGTASVVVTPSADLDRAAADLVASAFRAAGQHRSAASLAILVGSVGTSERFRRQLADAVTSLATGSPIHPGTQIGPLAAPPAGAAALALTRLGDGESWLVTPHQLDETDRVWSPGVRDGVAPDAETRHLGAGVPVLALTAVPTLDDAIALQNASDDALVAGLQSLDAREIADWAERVEAGTLVVNAPFAGPVARRRPLGGWKGSAVGPVAHIGGPDSVLVLGDWRPEPGPPSEELHLDGLDERVRAVIEAFQPALDFAGFDRVRRSAFDDERVWATGLGRGQDPAGLVLERNVHRYRPAEVVVRLSAGADLADLARVLCAGVRVRARMLVSSAVPLPSGMLPLVDDGTPLGGSPIGLLGVQVEGDAEFRGRVARGRPARIRLLGGDASALAHATGIDVTVWAGPVTESGRIELLPFLREQTVTVTAHRYGIPDREVAALRLD